MTKPQGSDQLRPYRTPRDEVSQKSALEEELDADSVFDPLLGLSSQSSQPSGSQPNASPDTTMGAAGPKTPPHFSETLPSSGCQLQCCLSQQARMRCSTWHQDHLLRAQRRPESVVGREFRDAAPVLTAQCCWDPRCPP